MKKIIYSAVTILILISSSGCKKWLDVNVNPNNPQVVAPNLYLGPMLTNFVSHNSGTEDISQNMSKIGLKFQVQIHMTDMDMYGLLAEIMVANYGEQPTSY